jgi:hypothetical protein
MPHQRGILKNVHDVFGFASGWCDIEAFARHQCGASWPNFMNIVENHGHGGIPAFPMGAKLETFAEKIFCIPNSKSTSFRGACIHLYGLFAEGIALTLHP